MSTQNGNIIIDEQKDIQHYAMSVNAWYNTALEHDKSILTLSAGGIGLLLTLLTTGGVASAESLLLYVLAILSFLASLTTVLTIFRNNKSYIERILHDVNYKIEPALGKLDSLALYTFGIGVLFTSMIGVSTAINSHTQNQKAKNMASENKSLNQIEITESFNKAGNLRLQTAVPATVAQTPGANNVPVTPAPTPKTDAPKP